MLTSFSLVDDWVLYSFMMSANRNVWCLWLCRNVCNVRQLWYLLGNQRCSEQAPFGITSNRRGDLLRLRPSPCGNIREEHMLFFDGTMWPHYIIMRPQFGVREKTNHRKMVFPKFPYQMDMVFLQVVKNYTGRCRYNVVNTTWYCAMADAECKSIFFSQNRHAKSHANGWFTECLMWGFGRKQTTL